MTSYSCAFTVTWVSVSIRVHKEPIQKKNISNNFMGCFFLSIPINNMYSKKN